MSVFLLFGGIEEQAFSGLLYDRETTEIQRFQLETTVSSLRLLLMAGLRATPGLVAGSFLGAGAL
jgi:hypothetical protein